MSIRPICDFCKKELRDFGGILFSPPDKRSMVKKYHVCKNCYNNLEKDIKKTK